MNKFLATLGVLVLALAFAAPCFAKSADSLILSGAWVRATPPNATVAGAYIRIENTGTKADRLLSATSSAAESVQIHEMKMDGDVMQMRELTEGLEIPAKKTVELFPGQIHLMLIGPQQAMVVGKTIKINLLFAKAGKKTVEFEIYKQVPVR